MHTLCFGEGNAELVFINRVKLRVLVGVVERGWGGGGIVSPYYKYASALKLKGLIKGKFTTNQGTNARKVK